MSTRRTGAKALAGVLAFAAIAGCATSPQIVFERCQAANLPDVRFLGLIKPKDAVFAYQDYAEQAFVYAQLSDIAYPNAPWNPPDGYVLIDAIDDAEGTGFAAKLFEDRAAGRLTRVVIAFRGTEGMALFGRDWRNGNLSMNQQPLAEAYFKRWRDHYPTDIPIVVTGHSLGGALALQVSINYPKVDAFVFNSSYRFKLHRRVEKQEEGQRLSISETGEAVKAVRGPLPNPTITHLPDFDCTRGNPVANHDMTKLARCLTRVAAARLQAAQESLKANQIRCQAPASLAAR